jgi:hypothetical protein
MSPGASMTGGPPVRAMRG